VCFNNKSMFSSSSTLARRTSTAIQHLKPFQSTKARTKIIPECLASPRRAAVASVRTTPLSKRYQSTSLASPPLKTDQGAGRPSENHDDDQGSTQGSSRMRIQFKCIAPSPSSSPSSQPPPIEPPHDDHSSTATLEQPTCGHLNTHEFSSQAFHHGIVLVQCPSCLNRHLIADHLQWFTSNPTSDDPNFKNDHRTIIDLMRAKGEAVKRGRVITSHHARTHPHSQPADTPNSGEVLEFYQ